MMPNIVFTDEFIQSMSDRYGSRPVDQKPFVYFLATEDQFKEAREIIEEIVTDLPVCAQRKLRGKLRSKENCTNTYHELMVGATLRKMGYIIDYEKTIDGKTPDWLIINPETKEQAILEVFTCNVSEEEATTVQQLKDLANRLKRIQKNVYLGIYYDRSISLDQNRNKEIADEVSQWLEKGVKVGDKRSWKGLNGTELKIAVEMVDKKLRYVYASPSSEYARFIDSKPLKKKIQNKIKEYKKIAIEFKLPLIVAIVADPDTGYDVDSLEEALQGSDITRVYFDQEMGKIAYMENLRGDDGIQADNKLLSGVIWMRHSSNKGWQIEYYSKNPEALYPFDILSFT